MTAKEYLQQAYRLNELIDSDVHELERLRDLAGRISSPNFGERVQSSRNLDAPFVKYLGDIMEMEEKIQKLHLPEIKTGIRRGGYMEQLLWSEMGDYVRKLLEGGY